MSTGATVALAVLGAGALLATMPARGAGRPGPAGPLVDPGAGERFPLLDALRALAITLVVAFHLLPALGVPTHGTAVLYGGVPIFFSLSAFLLYRPFAVSRLRGERAALVPFAWRRVARIVPGYAVALVLIAWWAAEFHPLALDAIPVHLLFLQTYLSEHAREGLQHAWAIDVEVSFYVLLGVWVLACRGRPLRPGSRDLRIEIAVLAAVVLAGPALRVLLIEAAPASRLSQTLVFYVDAFAIGMLVALLHAVQTEKGGSLNGARASHRPKLIAASCAAAVALTGAGVVVGEHSAYAERLQLGWSVVGISLSVAAAGALLLAAVLAGSLDGRVARLLASAPVAGLARISYGVYLWHVTVIYVLIDAGWAEDRPVLLAITAPTAAVALGLLSWRLVERPFVRLAHRASDPLDAWRQVRVAAVARIAPASPSDGGR